jgi:alpha-L-rhamnosidase
MGVDAARPRFGWKLGSKALQQRQAGYRIQVSSTRSGTGDVWDSGHVPSDQQIDIAYAGSPLASLTRYFWRVRVWDTQGRAGAWSRPQWFETGLLAPADEWRAAFIGQPAAPDLSGASWIWYAEGDPAAGRPVETRYFRRTFTLTGSPSAATLVVTGDDTADVWVNGVLVSASPRVNERQQHDRDREPEHEPVADRNDRQADRARGPDRRHRRVLEVLPERAVRLERPRFR